MSTDIATRSDAVAEYDEEVLVQYLGLNPRDPKSRAVVAVCKRYAFDPLLKHVIVIPKGGVYITRDGLLHAAHRSGMFDGLVVDEEPHVVDGEWRCRVSVYRKDMSHPFTFPGRYPVNGDNRQYAQEMALKVAEAHALRRAFDVSGLAIQEEMVISETAAPTVEPAQHRPSNRDRIMARAPESITDAQRGKLHALFAERGIPDAEGQRMFIADTLNREPSSRANLTKADAGKLIDALEALPVADEEIVDAEPVEDEMEVFAAEAAS